MSIKKIPLVYGMKIGRIVHFLSPSSPHGEIKLFPILTSFFIQIPLSPLYIGRIPMGPSSWEKLLFLHLRGSWWSITTTPHLDEIKSHVVCKGEKTYHVIPRKGQSIIPEGEQIFRKLKCVEQDRVSLGSEWAPTPLAQTGPL